MEKTYYVAGFMFSPDFENVVLIEKEKPEWQAGKYNAIGGKIEFGEIPVEAMVREFYEEANVETKKRDWNTLCVIGDEKYEVHFFYCSHKNWADYSSQTTEEVFHVHTIDLHTIRHKVIENLNWLIPMALDKAKNFSGYIRL